MLHLLKYSFLSKVRNFNIIFWPLVFPLVLGTFFYFAFGNINEADFQTVPVAVVKDSANTEVAANFVEFLTSDEAMKVFEAYGFSKGE